MKSKKLTLISLTLLAIILVGASAILVLSRRPVEANVKFDPDTIDLGAPGWVLREVVVTVWFKGKYDGRDVDPKTILVDGLLEPKGGWKHGTWIERVKIKELKINTWVFKFKLAYGDLTDRLWQKIGHITPGVVKTVPLVVTGNLYDGTTFEGTGYIDVLIPSTIPANPPPPPP